MNSQEPEDKTLQINLSTLRVLLYGDDRLESIRPSSKAAGDTAKVVIMPYHIGVAIQAIDKDNNFLHVELISESPEHAEIWLDFEWKDSNAKLERGRVRSAEERTLHEKNKAKINAISSKLKSFGFNQPGFAEHLAKEIISNWKAGDYSEMLKTLDLANTLKELDEET